MPVNWTLDPPMMTTDDEFQLVQDERDNAILGRDKAMGLAADAVAVAERAMLGRPVPARIINQLRERLDRLTRL